MLDKVYYPCLFSQVWSKRFNTELFSRSALYTLHVFQGGFAVVRSLHSTSNDLTHFLLIILNYIEYFCLTIIIVSLNYFDLQNKCNGYTKKQQKSSLLIEEHRYHQIVHLFFNFWTQTIYILAFSKCLFLLPQLFCFHSIFLFVPTS